MWFHSFPETFLYSLHHAQSLPLSAETCTFFALLYQILESFISALEFRWQLIYRRSFRHNCRLWASYRLSPFMSHETTKLPSRTAKQWKFHFPAENTIEPRPPLPLSWRCNGVTRAPIGELHRALRATALNRILSRSDSGTETTCGRIRGFHQFPAAVNCRHPTR